ncbi:MAG: PhoPQ-activated pathogenicity-related family protein [Myxococcota bacterium]|nr:PhoPQ-activated pathogenicity-related family protein [Myxococcota bacterium]
MKRCVPLVTLLVLAASCAPRPPGPLETYLAQPDSSFSYRLEQTWDGQGYKAYLLALTSQTWRSAAEVDRPDWGHQLTLVVPTGVRHTTAALVISGGSNSDQAPRRPEEAVVRLATLTGSVAIELRQVPNQPLRFLGDPTPRSEDDLLAYTWARVIATGDPTWTARFPMVKSAVRAMDVAQAFLRSEAGVTIEHFVVAGGSKRGWTSWLTGAMDPRVVAIIPVVIDVLNLEPSMRHHFAAYGFWARAVRDYVHHGITGHLGTPATQLLVEIEDPYSYRDRLKLPKYIVNATGDQFFLPDSSRFYFDDLPGEKYLRYVPNADHSLANTDAVQGILAYYQAILEGTPRPSFSWEMEGEDALVLRTSTPPLQVLLWQAHNPQARDFRVDTIGRTWQSTVLSDQGGGLYRGRVPRPARGFSAFFLEVTYPSGSAFPFQFSTPVRVVPDVLPYAHLDPRTGRLESDP